MSSFSGLPRTSLPTGSASAARRIVTLLAAGLPLVALACGDSAVLGPPDDEGPVAVGGAPSGGTTNGGAPNGGEPSGGVPSGGTGGVPELPLGEACGKTCDEQANGGCLTATRELCRLGCSFLLSSAQPCQEAARRYYSCQRQQPSACNISPCRVEVDDYDAQCRSILD